MEPPVYKVQRMSDKLYMELGGSFGKIGKTWSRPGHVKNAIRNANLTNLKEYKVVMFLPQEPILNVTAEEFLHGKEDRV